MKQNISKQTLSFMTSKKYLYVRTPRDVWKDLRKEFNFTIDVCASHKNHLLPRYYTEKEDGLKQDWSGEIVYCHPMFDGNIGKWVEKAFNSKCITVMLLPTSTHTRYFHKFIWDKNKHYPRKNIKIRFLEKGNKGFHFGQEDGTYNYDRIGYIKPLMIVIFRNNAK